MTDPDASAGAKADVDLPMITSSSKGMFGPIHIPFMASEAAHNAALTYAPAFLTDPVVRWLLCPSSASKPNLITSPKFRYRMWHLTVRQTISNGGHITNVDGDWDSVGIYFVPGTNNDSVFRMLASSMLSTFLWVSWHMRARLVWRAGVTYPGTLEKFKKNYFLPERLKKYDFYLIAYLATLESRRSQGLGSKWVRWVQAKAAPEGKPIWVETSTARAKAMYERCGFWTVDEETLGAGDVDEEGWSVKKGREGEGHEATGVKLWALVWWPPGMKEERKSKLEEKKG